MTQCSDDIKEWLGSGWGFVTIEHFIEWRKIEWISVRHSWFFLLTGWVVVSLLILVDDDVDIYIRWYDMLRYRQTETLRWRQYEPGRSFRARNAQMPWVLISAADAVTNQRHCIPSWTPLVLRWPGGEDSVSQRSPCRKWRKKKDWDHLLICLPLNFSYRNQYGEVRLQRLEAHSRLY
jgi:hypothetical protein